MGTSNANICTSNGVRGYPTLLFFKKGETAGQKYAGGRDIESFDKFVQKIIDPSSVGPEPEKPPTEACEVPAADNGLLALKDCNFVEATKEGHSFVKFYAPWCGHCKKM